MQTSTVTRDSLVFDPYACCIFVCLIFFYISLVDHSTLYFYLLVLSCSLVLVKFSGVLCVMLLGIRFCDACLAYAKIGGGLKKKRVFFHSIIDAQSDRCEYCN